MNSTNSTPRQIIDITKIAGKSLDVIETVIGEAEIVDRHTEYPRVAGYCEKANFQGGKYEVIFSQGVANRITIHGVPDLTENTEALQVIGLKKAKPSFYNPTNVIRWEKTQGFDEISFFTDYILIDTSKEEFAKK